MGKIMINGNNYSGSSDKANKVFMSNGESVEDAVNEVSQNLGGVRLGIDGDGNRGYYGADDSFVPFKSGGYTNLFTGYIGTGKTYEFTKNYDTVIVMVSGSHSANDCYVTFTPTLSVGTYKTIEQNRKTEYGSYYISMGVYELKNVKAGDKVYIHGHVIGEGVIFAIG